MMADVPRAYISVRITCMNNLHQAELSMAVYTMDAKDKLPQWTIGNWAWDMPVPMATAEQ